MKKSMYRELYNKPLESDVVIYAKHIYAIGGIESWIYYTCKRYNIGQITVLYEHADKEQLKRLNTVVTTLQYTGQKIKCNKLIYVAPIYMNQELHEGAKERYVVNH